MLIKGIRSFCPENDHAIVFPKPLTLIVGRNGAGKTVSARFSFHLLPSDRVFFFLHIVVPSLRFFVGWVPRNLQVHPTSDFSPPRGPAPSPPALPPLQERRRSLSSNHAYLLLTVEVNPRRPSCSSSSSSSHPRFPRKKTVHFFLGTCRLTSTNVKLPRTLPPLPPPSSFAPQQTDFFFPSGE